MLAIVGNTIDIKDAATEIISISKLFLILECYVLDLKLAFKQVVQKIYQQVLAELLTEETLEAPVGKGLMYLPINYQFRFCKSAAKINFYFETCKKIGRKFQKNMKGDFEASEVLSRR